MEDTNLYDYVQNLFAVEDEKWGLYAFARDNLKDKVDQQTKNIMIKKAIDCGYERADKISFAYGTDPFEISKKLQINVKVSSQEQSSDRILFALFTPPNDICIWKDPIIKVATSTTFINNTLDQKQLMAIILGHEIFHFIEENDSNIYTRTEKITLWKFLGYQYKSTIRALSEIAAMYFTKRLNNISWSPFALDFILYYNYDIKAAMTLYEEVIQYR